jgi:hypothetical protein
VTLPALAVKVTVCAVLTEETVAVKLALLAPAATVTEAGTVTAVLLLARLTVNPPLGAAAFSVTVQLSVPAPVMDPLAQVSALSAGTPVPLRLTTADDPLEEVLVMVSWPAAIPVAVGEKSTLKLNVPPPATETGRSPRPVRKNGCPVTLTCITCTEDDPVFVSNTFEPTV